MHLVAGISGPCIRRSTKKKKTLKAGSFIFLFHCFGFSGMVSTSCGSANALQSTRTGCCKNNSVAPSKCRVILFPRS